MPEFDSKSSLRTFTHSFVLYVYYQYTFFLLKKMFIRLMWS